MRYINGQPERRRDPEDGFDCSGLIRYVLEHAGLAVPDFIGADGKVRPIRHANDFFDVYGVTVHSQARRPGDLIFFSRDGERPTHIGIVGPDDPDHYIHAIGRDNTEVAIACIAHTAIRHTGDGRQWYVENPIGFKAPVEPIGEPTYRWHQRPIE